jgi:hypothetical protein
LIHNITGRGAYASFACETREDFETACRAVRDRHLALAGLLESDERLSP